MRQDIDRHCEQIVRRTDKDMPWIPAPSDGIGFGSDLGHTLVTRVGRAQLALTVLLLGMRFMLVIRLDAAPRSYVDEP